MVGGLDPDEVLEFGGEARKEREELRLTVASFHLSGELFFCLDSSQAWLSSSLVGLTKKGRQRACSLTSRRASAQVVALGPRRVKRSVSLGGGIVETILVFL